LASAAESFFGKTCFVSKAAFLVVRPRQITSSVRQIHNSAVAMILVPVTLLVGGLSAAVFFKVRGCRSQKDNDDKEESDTDEKVPEAWDIELGPVRERNGLGNVDTIIRKCRTLRGKKGKLPCSAEELQAVARTARELFSMESPLLEIDAPIHVIGGLHGHFQDLLRLLDLDPPSACNSYLFLGNYVDRGLQSMATLVLLCAYKAKLKNFFMLRGIHESASVSRIYGFFNECKKDWDVKTWKVFCDTFNSMPLAAIVSGKIFCVHGGLSRELTNLDQIRRLVRPFDVPDTGLICDLLWADFDEDTPGWAESERGVSYTFGLDKLQDFCKNLGFDFVVCGSQVQEHGFQWFGNKELVKIWGCTNLCGELTNNGVMMTISRTDACSSFSSQGLNNPINCNAKDFKIDFQVLNAAPKTFWGRSPFKGIDR